MHQLITIGDPVIDTHVQLDERSAITHLNEGGIMKLCLPYGEKLPIVDSFQALGGNAANVAAGATRLGLKTAIVTTIGQDGLGDIARSLLEHAGVDLDYISRDPQCRTRYSIVLNYEAERTILSYGGRRKYVWPTTMAGTEWVYYTGLSAGFEMLQGQLLGYLSKHPTVQLAVNPGTYMLHAGLESLQPILTRTDVLILNLQEAELLAGTTLAKEKSVQSLIHELLALGPKEIAITDGPRGAWAGDDEIIWHMDTLPVKVVAKTGAGDAFSAGYIAARQLGHDIEHALTWGVANSCGVIQEHGAQTGMQTAAGVQSLLQKYPKIKTKTVV